MDYEIFVTPGLGDNSYLFSSAGDAVLVDPQRDVSRFLDHIYHKDLNLIGVLETHVHNDYISGALEIRDEFGIDLYLPEKGGYEFEHKPVKEGFSMDLGQSYQIEVLDTPGHTYEHISWVVKDRAEPVGVFTGGSLIIGSAGRTDLLGEDHTDELTRLQYESIHKLSGLPDQTQILPTHGAGSFCTSSNPSETRTSTLEVEKNYNQAVTAQNIEEFIARQLTGLLEYPMYYAYMAEINRKGPTVYGEVPIPRALNIGFFRTQIRKGAYIVDLRDRLAYARAHIPQSYNFELKPSMANYLGWIIPFNAPIVLVSSGYEDVVDATTQLFRIGYENILGYLDGGMETWLESNLPVISYTPLSTKDLVTKLVSGEDLHIIDVRQPSEYEEQHLEHSTNIFLPRISSSSLSFSSSNVGIICGSGQRSAIAASILSHYGVNVLPVYDGGIEEVIEQTTEKTER